MRQVKDNKYGYRSWLWEDVWRYGKFLILPLILVIVAAAVLIMNRGKESGAGGETVSPESTLAADSPSQFAGAEETEPAETEAGEFTTDQTPAVQELMNRYFTAKQNGDAETIYSLFGWTDTAGLETLRSQLQYDARYTEGYRNIICYTTPALEEGSYLVYVSYDLKFKNSLTLAPGLLWNYVKTGEDGNLYLTDSETLTQDELDFVAEEEKKDEIVLLKTEIYAKLRLALEEDSALAESYGILEKQGGVAGAGQQETQHEVTVQIGAAGDESEAGTEAGTEGEPSEEPDSTASAEESIDSQEQETSSEESAASESQESAESAEREQQVTIE